MQLILAPPLKRFHSFQYFVPRFQAPINWVFALGVIVICVDAIGNDSISEGQSNTNSPTYQALVKEYPDQIALPPGIEVNDGLDESEAIALALRNNAEFQVVLAQMGIDQADLLRKRQWSNPIFSLIFPYGPRQWEITTSMPLHELWLRPQQVASAVLESEANLQIIMSSGLDLVRQVRLSLVEIQLTKRLFGYASKMASVQESFVQLVAKRNQLGLTDYHTVVQARKRLNEMKIEEERLVSQFRLKSNQLKNLIGLSEYKNPVAFATVIRLELQCLEPYQYRALAIKARPDYRAAELGLELAAKKLGIARTEFYNFVGKLDIDFPNGNGKAAPGLEFGIPLLNQGKGQRKQAQAIMHQSMARFSSIRHQILDEVDTALANYVTAQEQLRQTKENILLPLEMEWSRVNEAANANLIDGTLAFQAKLDWIAGETEWERLRASFLVSIIELERATGSKINLDASSS